MNGRQAKKLRQAARRLESDRIDHFKSVVEKLPFFDRVGLAIRIIFKTV